MKKMKLVVAALFLTLMFGMTVSAKTADSGSVTVSGSKGTWKLGVETAQELAADDGYFAPAVEDFYAAAGVKDGYTVYWTAPYAEESNFSFPLTMTFKNLNVTANSEVKVYNCMPSGDGSEFEYTVLSAKAGKGQVKVDFKESGVAFVAIAVKDGETSSSSSSSSSSTDSTVTSLPQVTNLRVNDAIDYRTMKLTWDEVAGAQKYEIWYHTDSNPKLKRLTTTKVPAYTYSKAKCGETYYFQVRAVAKKAKGAYSETVSGTTELTGNLDVGLVSSKTTYNSVTIAWGKKDVPGAKKFQVFCCPASVDPSTVTTPVKTTGGNKYTFKNLQAGVEYRFWVVPMRDSDKGAASNSVYEMPELKFTSKVKVKAASGTKGETSLKVTWGRVRGAASYEVARLVKLPDGEIIVEQIYEFSGSARTSFVDTGLIQGVEYTYEVTAKSGCSAVTGVGKGRTKLPKCGGPVG